MKYLPLIAVVVCAVAGACSVKEETVVQRPAPAPAVVYSTAPAPTVIVPQ